LRQASSIFELMLSMAGTLKGRDDCTAHQCRANAGDLEFFARRTERPFDERCNLRSVFRKNAQRLGRDPGALERGNALLRPRDVLKHTNRESSGIDIDHAL